MLKPKTKWEMKKEEPVIKAAMILTKCDIQKFKQYLVLLSSDSITDEAKQAMILFIKNIQDSLKKMQDFYDESNFAISYNHFFNECKCYELASQEYLHKSTIVKMNQKFVLKLSEILYPDLHICN